LGRGARPESAGRRRRSAGSESHRGDQEVRSRLREAQPGDGLAMDVLVPDIGDFKDVPVIEVHVKPGDKVEKEQPLVTLESDKATLDVPSPAAGTVREVAVKVGDKISQGTLIARMDAATAAPVEQVAPEKAYREP